MISTFLQSKLRPWQPAIVEAGIDCLSRENGFLNASGLGSGKSFIGLATAYALRKKPIFMCRLGVKETMREIAVNHFGFADSDVATVNIESIRTGKQWLGTWTYGEADHSTGKREKIFRWNVPSNSILIWDECHNASAQRSQNSIMMRNAVEQGVKIMGLSGTAADDPRRMRAIGYMLGLHQDFDWWGWMSLYGATEDSWSFGLDARFLDSDKGKAELDRMRKAAMAKIHQQLAKAGRMVRLRTSEIPGFPQSSVHPIAVDFDSKEMNAIFEEMRFELAELKSKGRGRTQLEIMMRARQRAELLMVPGWADMARDAIEEGESVVFFLNFTATVKALAEKLKTECTYTGENLKTRGEWHARFMADKERVIVTNLAAASESIGFQDLHGNFPRTGIVSSSFWAAQMNQVLGRLPRDGAKTPSKYFLTFPRNSVMEKAYLACKRRTELYGVFNGDIQFTDEDLQAGLPI